MAMEKAGLMVVPGGGLRSKDRRRGLLDWPATTVCGTPSYLLYLAETARKNGIDLPGSSIVKVVAAGEPGGALYEEVSAALKDIFDPEIPVNIYDLGLIYGEAVFDTSRTFGGRLFRLSDHIDRLYESLTYARIDPGMTQAPGPRSGRPRKSPHARNQGAARAAGQRPPPGPATGRAFFAEIFHWKISDRSSPPSGGRFCGLTA